MRNLKKILALVLALVMSLSLMATAGATDFKDDGDISDTYRQAAQVLFELGVFNGDQNGQFNPDQPIARSEVAAILYRIATGDIGLEGNKTYAPYNQFPDVSAEDWYAGYVTYCANAGYIKGRNTGKFDAKDDVTGYEVLAMILRAVGYDKNNEFVGSNWQEHTASLATQKGVLVNVLEDPNVRLSQPATREVVAELLFRASLLPQVTYNAATLSYVEDGETLAKANLGMERIEGVVVANEWADLRYDYIDADEGETVLETADGERTLVVPTDLTDIGESRYAYVVGTKVLGQLEDTGKNIVADCADLDPAGGETYVSDLAGSSIRLTEDTEYFYNFNDRPRDTSAYRIEYSVSFRTDEAKEWFETEYLYQSRNIDDYELEIDAAWENNYYSRSTVNKLYDTVNYYADANGDPIDLVDSNGDAGPDGNADYPQGRTFSRVIPAGETITQLDKDIMNGIFSSAASFDSKHENFADLSKDIVHAGYVYAGTKSNPDTADGKNDLSDDMTYAQFAEQYIGTDASMWYNFSTNGAWLKVVDNDGDGKAEYALKTGYYLVEVDDYNDRTDTYFFSNGSDTDDGYLLRDEEYEFAVGDMLLCAWIDGQWVIEEAESEVLTIEAYSWKDVTVTTTDGRVLSGSGSDVGNGTEYDDILANILYNVEYEVFYDHYGFIRAFRLVDSDRHYGLLTDLYLTDQRNTHYIDNQIATVELSFLDEDGKLDMDEYDVSNHSKTVPNVFVGVNQTAVYGGVGDTDNLQRAMAHLGMVERDSNGRLPDGRTTASDDMYKDSLLGWEFDYDHDTSSVGKLQDDDDNSNSNTPGNDSDTDVNTDTNITYSNTNVARYTLNEDGTVALSSVSEYAYDKAGNQMYYWNGDPAEVDADNAVVGGARMTLAQWAEAYDDIMNVGSAAAATAANNNTVPVYAVDYVMLDTTVFDASNGISSSNYRFKIDDSYSDGTIYDGSDYRNDGNLNNWHVNTVNDTVFYVVTPTDVYAYVGYRNLPAIKGNTVTAMYAVAQNVTQDNNYRDYWVADVVVIEVNAGLEGVYSHLIYNVYDNYRAGQKAIIHELSAIDCVTGEVISVVVDSSWNQAYSNGFYVLQNAETAADGSITATGMQRVEDHATYASKGYAGFGIYAGEIVRSSNVEDRGSYIEVFDQTGDDNENGDERYVPLNGAPWYSVYATSASEANKAAGRLYTERLVNKDYDKMKPNRNEVIYVTDSRGNVVFLIDTSFDGGDYWYTPIYLNEGIRYEEDGVTKEYNDTGVYNTAMRQQSDEGTVISPEKKHTIKFYKDSDYSGETLKDGVEPFKTVGIDEDEDLFVELAVAGYTISSVEKKSGTGTLTTVTAGSRYLFSNVTENIVVKVTLTQITKTLTVDADADTDNAGTVAKNINVNNGEYNSGSKPALAEGADVVITFDADAYTVYTYTSEALDVEDEEVTVKGGVGTITFEMPDEAVTVTITATKMGAEEIQAIVEAAVIPEQVSKSGAAIDTSDSLDYATAYARTGIEVKTEEGTAKITVDTTKLETALANPAMAKALATLRPHDVNGIVTDEYHKFLAAGVAFAAPEGAEGANIYISEEREASESDVTNNLTSAGEAFTTADDGTSYVNVWTAFADGDHKSDATNGCLLENIVYRADRTRYVYIQFLDGDNQPIGDPVLRVVTVELAF